MKCILVIEDETFIRENLEDILTLEGFKTLTASDGVMGIQLAQQAMPDLIICDIMMPYGDGYHVLKTLQTSPETEAIPFIFLTAKADRSSMREGMNLGADDYLTKPFTPQEVVGAIQTRLKKHSAQVQTISHLTSQLEYESAHEPFTGLPNRLSLEAVFQDLMRAVDSAHPYVALSHVTLDQLPSIRTVLGSELSHHLVQAIGQRLKALDGVADLAYLSDHQFAVAMLPTASVQQIHDWVEACVSRLSAPFVLNQHELFLNPKIGIALFSQDGTTLDTLLLRAEMAAAGLSNQQQASISFYSPNLYDQVKQQFELEIDLHHALERQQFQVYYQPQIDLHQKQLIGAEALVRWFHPEQGSISPAQFIPIAETNGLIGAIGEWVLQTASRQAKVWQLHYPEFRISVNLSGRQFGEQTLLQTIAQSLHRAGLQPHHLELEITESILMQDTTLAQQLLTDLHQINIRVAIDDFGVGYSSFNYLQQFPLSTLKIDRSFIQNLAEDAKKQKIAAGIIQMAHDLGLQVVAEGVEQIAQFEILKELQCDIAQGYYFSPPLSKDNFEQYVIRAQENLIRL